MHAGGDAFGLVDHTIAFADLEGNRQFITRGNQAENPKAQLFLIDYATRTRIKIWGSVRVVARDASLLRRLAPADDAARARLALVFGVTAWDANCPRHIPLRLDAADVQAALAERDRRIAELQAQLEQLSGRSASTRR